MIRLTEDQLMALVDADWLADGPIRLNRSLTADDLSHSAVAGHAQMVLGNLADGSGVKLTQAENFNRKFVARSMERFRWPGYDFEELRLYYAVINEFDFMPLDFIHRLIDLAGPTRLGQSLLAPDAVGELNGVLFDTTFNLYNLGYLDRMLGTEDFQRQTGLTLFLMNRIDGRPRSPEEWFALTALPDDFPRSHPHFRTEHMFGQRILRYLN